MPTATYTKNGSKATTPVKLDNAIFGVKEINHRLLQQSYDSYLANGRQLLARTKTRGLVRGGGRKPWQQKGTGRARVGSRRTPIWRGGGIIFGPTGNENYTKRLSANAKRKAIIQALSAHNMAGSLRVIESIELKSPKTSELNKLLNKLDIRGYTLIASDNLETNLKLASRNLENVKAIQVKYLNIARLLDADTIIITKPALAQLNEWLKTSDKKDSN